MTHSSRILELFESSPDGRVYVWQLQKEYLYHKASSRICDLRKKGHPISEFIKGSDLATSYYEMAYLVDERTGQYEIFRGAFA